ncbi:hypothetical protein ANN_25823 [Periplaneta americana]|uniref:DUF4817 domain-containing protein n=1 Tax=Periplaneta americana TaxID=6978 RepID=A0ABQ8S4K3_PERAM|nr:hypothetical protein ANN_25823 [Periplaneta americana]
MLADSRIRTITMHSNSHLQCLTKFRCKNMRLRTFNLRHYHSAGRLFTHATVLTVQRQWRREYETEPPTRLTIKRIIDKFEAHGTICDIHKGRSGRPHTATSAASSALVLERLEHIKTLEKIQKRALKCCRKNSPLKWDTLTDRRTRIRLCALFKTYREAIIRKEYLPISYQNSRKRERSENIWVSVDESTDVSGRYVANVVVGILSKNCVGKKFVLTSEKLEKVIWVCILCRKKQELLSKTGQWINKGMAAGDAIMRRIEADLHQQPEDITPTLTTPIDKRPKLERAHSAAEKENVPLVRSGSVLRRQYSQQEQPTRRMSASDSGVDVISPSQRPIGRGREPSLDRGQSFQQPYHEDDPRYYRSELEGLMRSQQQQPYPHHHGPGLYGSDMVHGVGVSGGFRNDSLSSEQSSSMDMTSCPPAAVMRGSSGAPMMMMMPTGGGGGNSKKPKRSGSGKRRMCTIRLPPRRNNSSPSNNWWRLRDISSSRSISNPSPARTTSCGPLRNAPAAKNTTAKRIWTAFLSFSDIQRIPNLAGPVASMTSRCSEIRNKTAGRIDGYHGNCTSCCLCYASKMLRNFRTPISFKEKIA